MHYEVKTEGRTVSQHTRSTSAHRRAMEAAQEHPGKPVAVFTVTDAGQFKSGATYRSRR